MTRFVPLVAAVAYLAREALTKMIGGLLTGLLIRLVGPGTAEGNSTHPSRRVPLTYTNTVLGIGHGDTVVRGQGYGDRLA